MIGYWPHTVPVYGVLAGDLSDGVLVQLAHGVLYDLTGVGPNAIGVWVVGTPDEVVDADVVGHVANAGVLLEGGGALSVPVLAGFKIEGRVEFFVEHPVGVFDVHALDYEGHPAGAAFAEDELEVGESLAGAAHDDADEPFGAGKLAEGGACALEGQLVLGRGVGEVGRGEVSGFLRRLDFESAASADVERYGHLGFGGGFPEGVPVAVPDVDRLDGAAYVKVGASEAEGSNASKFLGGHGRDRGRGRRRGRTSGRGVDCRSRQPSRCRRGRWRRLFQGL